MRGPDRQGAGYVGYAPRVPSRARTNCRLSLWLALVVVSAGCSPAPDESNGAPRSARAADPEDWGAALRDPSVETTLRAVGQPHAAVREGIGPHRLHYTAELSLEDPTTDDAEALPELDAPAVLDDSVKDELELLWAPRDGATRFSLRQLNDKDRGREVILVDGRVHTRERHRAWEHYAVETDLHERWLDDAQRAVHDVLELAAPRLHVTAKDSSTPDLVVLQLGLAEATTEALRRAGTVSRWRGGAEIQQVSGEIVLEASTGAWRSATVDVRYALQAADGRTLRGTVHFEGAVEPLSAGGGDIRAPADSEPLAERTRLQAERQELLDGLAAPR